MNELVSTSNLWRDALRRLKANRLALAGAIFVFVLILLALLTPFIAPYEYDFQNRGLRSSGPSLNNWLGTDYL